MWIQQTEMKNYQAKYDNFHFMHTLADFNEINA